MVAVNKPEPLPGPIDTANKFLDLSGVSTGAYENPYDALIEASHGDSALLQSRYSTHRATRNSQQKAKLLSPEFSGLITDPILQKLVDPSIEPGFVDPRHCLVVWARPPSHILSLAGNLQQKLLAFVPNLWLMPLENMHLTALEIIHSVTDPEVQSIIVRLGPATIATLTDYTYWHRARLIKPMLSYDAAAIALSFVPAAGEGLPLATVDSLERSKADDNFTYHHLRRDLFNVVKKTGVSITSRYVVPTSHITIGRFLCQNDHDSPEKMEFFIKKIEKINEWLETEYWPKDGEARKEGSEWIVGHEKGLNFREGRLWYGGGNTVRLGKGF